MNDFILTHEGLIRLLLFLGVLGGMAFWEKRAPRRSLSVSKNDRWVSNLGLVCIDTILLRLLLPLQLAGLALFARNHGWGLLNKGSLPGWLAIIIAVIVLDFVIYLQHALFHFIPLFWRFHRVHHTDLDFDVTTGIRFHPVEILLSMGIKITAVVILGTPLLAVILFEALLNATSLFNHGNVRLSEPIDRVLRLLVVTPEMHRVHHSVLIREYSSNFGFSLPWWDRLLNTYRAQPEAGHVGMTIGNSNFRNPKQLTLYKLLIQPFVSHV